MSRVLCKRSGIQMATHYFGCSWPTTSVDVQLSKHHTACLLVDLQHQRVNDACICSDYILFTKHVIGTAKQTIVNKQKKL
jgi:hypothetical protein